VRVLVTSTPGAGHVLPVVPIARALRDRGHDVVWATGADSHALVRGAGLTPIAAGLDLATRGQQFREGWPPVSSIPPRQRRAVMFPALFATLSARPMYDDLRRVVDARRPDLVLHDPSELAAAPLARSLGIPCMTVGFGRLFPDALLASAASELTELWRDAGSEVPPDLGLYDHAYLHPLPPSLEAAPPGRPIHLVRPVGYDGSDEPVETAPAGERPRPSVYVTFGTEFGPVAPWHAVIEALATLDVDALLTVGGQVDLASLGPLPAGLRVERWVPQRRALAAADLVVSHGGSGAMIGAASAGLPHLALPLAADHFENADLIAAQGGGAMLDPTEVGSEAIAAVMHRLASESDARRAAGVLAAEIAAMPSPDDVAGRLERLVQN
jgi:calicheamicin 3'-O-methyl-rhamnosyltransferase